MLVALGTFAHLIKGKRVVIYIDSTAAIGSIVKGHSKRQDINLYAGTAWHILADLGVTPYFVRVPSKQNPADAPSRSEFADLEADPGAEWLRPRWPPQAEGLVDVSGAVCEHTFDTLP